MGRPEALADHGQAARFLMDCGGNHPAEEVQSKALLAIACDLHALVEFVLTGGLK